ncbi:uncharacterized protein LOC111635594 [Centruroides sculpturatus]|uniref:uncharacterized protein LOC111635594 n=1 Tax=Centruroides sculpturatus TaxID=218467 RepID=UPI000C6EA813|nr:uncharacterized protein LOC111635594 [Centruroides sculpturatus]
MLRHHLVITLINIILIKAQEEEGAPKCLKVEPESIAFQWSPGCYDPQTLTVSKCRDLCIDSKFKYAALQNGNRCLCGNSIEKRVEVDSCSLPCSGDGDKICGSEDPNVYTVYDITIKRTLERIALKISSNKSYTNEPVKVKIEIESSQELPLFINFGDGTTTKTSAFNEFSVDKTYLTPGIYDIVAAVTDNVIHKSLVSEIVRVQVEEKESNIQLECPEKTVPELESSCQVTTWKGSLNILRVEIGEAEAEEYKIPAPDIVCSGIAVPVIEDADILGEGPDKEILTSLQLPYGKIYSFEYYGVEEGSFDVIITQPSCQDGENCPTPTCGGSCLQCSTPFCSCSARCSTDQGSCASVRNTEGEEVHKYTFETKKGYNLRTLTEEEQMVIAHGSGVKVICGTAFIGKRDATDLEKELFLEDTDGDSNKVGRLFLKVCVARPFVFDIALQCEQTGKFSVNVVSISQESKTESSDTRNVECQQPIEKMTIEVEKHTISVLESWTLTIRFHKGSGIVIVYDYGNGTTEESEPEDDTKYIKEIVCHDSGIYNITVNASNVHGSEVDGVELRCFNPITDFWQLENNSPQPFPPGNVEFCLKFTHEGPLPSNAEAIIDFGDGLQEKVMLSEEITDCISTISHTYEIFVRERIATINITNPIEEKSFNTQVVLYPGDQTFIVTVNTTEQQFTDPDYVDALLGEELLFNITFGNMSDLGEVYQITFVSPDDNVTVENITEPSIRRNFKMLGEYVAYFTVFLYEMSTDYSHPISIFTYENLTRVLITHDGSIPGHGSSKEFNITLDKFDEKTCLIFYSNDGISLPQCFGNRNSCLEEYDDGAISSTCPPIKQMPIEVNFTYRDVRVVTVKAVAFNPRSTVFHETLVIIKKQGDGPIVWIENNHTTIANPYIHKRCEAFRLETTIILTSNMSYLTLKKWYINSTDPNGIETNPIDMSKFESNKSSLYLPPLSLQYGYYKFIFQCIVLDENDTNKELASEQDFTFVKITKCNLRAKILDTEESFIRKGFGQTIQLRGASLSFNPDDPQNKEGLTVSWFCKRKGETLQRGPKGNLIKANPSSPLKDESQRGGEDKGGCFCQGPGFVNMDGDVVFVTSWFCKSNETYIFVLQAQLGNRRSTTFLIVEVVDGTPPTMVIFCEKDHMCIRYLDKVYINKDKWLTLRYKCIEGCMDDMSIEWEASCLKSTDIEDENETHIADLKKYCLGDRGRLGINHTLFQAHQQCKQFRFRIIAKSTEGVGKTEMYLIINQPPEGGTCSLTPTEGTSLLQYFFMKCSGWTDPEGKTKVFTYTTMVNIIGMYTTTLRNGIKTSFDLVLPAGELEVFVIVTDNWDAEVTVLVAVAKVELPACEEYEEWKLLRWFDKAMGEGDAGLGSQIAVAEIMEIKKCSNSSLDNVDNLGNVSDDAINTKWNEFLDMEGADVSFFSPQAKEEVREMIIEQKESDMDNTAKNNNQMMARLRNLRPMETVEDLEMISGAISCITMNGMMDKEGMETALVVLRNSAERLEEISINSAEDIRNLLEKICNIMDRIVTSVATQQMGFCFKGDREKAEEEFENNPDTKNPFLSFVKPQTKKEAMKNKKQRATDNCADPVYAKEIIIKIQYVIVKIKRIVVELIFVNKPFNLCTESGFKLTIYKISKNTNDMVIKKRQAMFNSTDVCELSGKPDDDCSSDTTIAVQMVKWNRPFNCYSNNTDKLYKGSATIQLDIVDAENKTAIPQENYEKKFKFSIPRDDPTPCWNNVKVDFKSHNFLAYHFINVTDVGVSIIFQFRPSCDAPFVVFTKYDHKPTVKDFESIFRPEVDETGIFSMTLTTDEDIKDNSTLYIAVGHLANNTDADFFFDNIDSYNLTAENMTNKFSCNYSYCLFSTACYYFDENSELWRTDGCEVEAVSEMETNCSCDHLTSFAGSFLVAPNMVDFDYVFAHADFSNNYIIYMTLIVTFIIYVCLMIWARWKDKKDVRKLGATPLPDNDPKDKYIYEILVFTGHHVNAGTKSKVYFMVSGEDDETEVRTLADGKRPILRSGSVNVFVMSTSRSLGDLFYLRIWHDNSGKGKWASWFLQYIVFRDVQTGQKYEFIANKWFAVEEGDGLIDRLLPVAGKEQKAEFSHLFATTSRQKLSDSHLWFSIFLRPPRSRFTRVQRVSCCMAVLYLSMLANAMWYQRTSNQPSPGALKLGPFSLTMEQVMVGVISNFVVFPPSFLMIFFFRKSRPRRLRPSRIEEALKKQREAWETECGEMSANAGRGNSKPLDESAIKERIKRKRKFTLPWWCVVFGWFFVFASIGVSIFFLWAYGIQFGNVKTSKWLTALVISFFSSVLLTQPIKIFLIAMFLSMVCRKLDYDEDDADEDEEDPQLEKDEEWLHKPVPIRPERHMYRPLDPKAIEAARQEREKELRLHSLMKEICGYGAFLWLVIVMCMAERDPNGYYMRLNLINDFIKPGDLWNDFNNVNTEVRFWNWTNEALIPELIAGDWYNGLPPLGLRGFLDDRNNLKISYAIMRQIRIKPNSCAVAKQMKEFTPECAGYGSIVFEDGGLYGSGWDSNFTAESGTPPEYKYLTASQLKGYPFWGMMDYYSGGGYVVPLFEKQDDVRNIIKRLQKENWVGRHTRAIFVEISVYNAQVNLFAAVTIVAEFLPGGGITPYYHIDPIRLLFYHNNSGMFFLVVQILFLVFILYITIRELKTFYRQRMKYFDEYWNMCHFAILLFSYAGIAIFVYRFILTQQILKIFRETEGTGYVKLQEAVLYNCLLSYMLAFLMFLATLQFLKLLRFNKRMGILALTLRKVAEELRSFGICLMVVFGAFVFLFWLLLGRFMWEFSTFVLSFESCISMLLKKFKYPEMAAASPFFVPIVFFIFSISAAMVLINILLTIIIQSFEDVKQDIAKENKDSELLRFAIERVKMMVGVGRSKVQPLPPIVPTKKTVSTQDTLKAFPSKVDQLLQFVNNVYFDSEIDFNSKDLLRKMKGNQREESGKGKSGKRKPDTLRKYGSNKFRREFGHL